MGGWSFNTMVRWMSKDGIRFSMMCALPLWIRFGSSDFDRMNAIVVQFLVFRVSYSWVRKTRA